MPSSRIMVIDFDTTFYFHREGAGLLFGMGDPDEAPTFDTTVQWDFLPQVIDVAVKRLPALADASISHAWAGLYEVTPDANPIIGPADGVGGFYLINGFSGHGFQHSPAAGRILADLITGRDPAFDLTPFAAERFTSGAVSGERYFVMSRDRVSACVATDPHTCSMRYALRSLLKAREFTVVAVAIIAIGIGANTAVFSIVDAALLRPLPFKEPSRLFMLAGVNAKRGIDGASFSYPSFVELAARDQTRSGLDAVAAVANDRFNATGGERPEQLPGARVSASFFDVLGVDAAAGRTFTASEDAPGGPAVAILGRRYWTRRFGGSASAVGATITLNGAPYTIVGALGIELPPPFDDVDVWSTRVDEISGFTRPQIDGGLGYLTAVARLRPGVRVEQAQAEVDAIAHAYARANPTNTDADPDASLRLVPIRDRTVGSTRSPLLVLMGAVGLVLLVACANVANLLLVRATARSHEAAVRAALGASRWELTRWVCSESVVLALAGGLAGVLLAFWSVGLAESVLAGLPRGSEIAVNGRVLAFSFVVSLVAGIGFGLVPSSLVRRQSPADALKSGGRGATVARRGAGRVLVIVEVALSLMLLVGAGLLLQSFTRLTHVPVGFRSEGLLTMRVSLPTTQYADPAAMRSFMARLIPRLESIPGVASAAASMALPPTITTMAPYVPGDQPMVAIGERPVGQWSAITPGYFATMGIPLVSRARVHLPRHRSVPAGGHRQPESRAAGMAGCVTDRQKAPGRPVSGVRRSRRRRRRREEQRPGAGADAGDVHAVCAAAVAGDAVRAARRGRRSAGARELRPRGGGRRGSRPADHARRNHGRGVVGFGRDGAAADRAADGVRHGRAGDGRGRAVRRDFVYRRAADAGDRRARRAWRRAAVGGAARRGRRVAADGHRHGDRYRRRRCSSAG